MSFRTTMIVFIRLWAIIVHFLSSINKVLVLLVRWVLLRVLLFTLTTRLWKFYLIFEISLIPMLLLVFLSGINILRISAALYLTVYALIFSAPSFALVVALIKRNVLVRLEGLFMKINKVTTAILLIMFLVKIPLFLLHFWLPKAHVEASTVTSILLARVLLKTGGIGIVKLSQALKLKANGLVVLLLLFSGMSCLLVLLQRDFKKFVAFISVFHLNFSLCAAFCGSSLGMKRFVLINVVHSLVRGLMFYLGGIIIRVYGYRFMKRFNYKTYREFYVIVSVLMLINLGVPPFLRFFTEVWAVLSILSKSILLCLGLGLVFVASLLGSLKIIESRSRDISFKALRVSYTVFIGGFIHLFSYYSLVM